MRASSLDQTLTHYQSSFDRSTVHAARGFLIVLVVIGHISGGGGAGYHVRMVLYDFHVLAFFMIAMLQPAPGLGFGALVVVIKRYLSFLVPISFGAFVLFNALVAGTSASEVPSQVFIYLTALLGGNYYAFDLSTGLEVFWFMYALIGFIALRMVLASLPTDPIWQLSFLLLCCGIGIACAQTAAQEAPAWLGVATYTLPVVILAFRLVEILEQTEIRYGVSVIWIEAAIFLAMALFWVPENSFNLAWLRVPMPWDPLSFLGWILFIALSFRIVFVVAQWRVAKRILTGLGKRSMGIYLTHMFFLFVIDNILKEFVKVDPLRMIAALIAVLFMSNIAAKLIFRR